MSNRVMALTVEGYLLAAVAVEYNGFTDRQTGEVKPGGTRYEVWLSPGFGEAPEVVKVREAPAFAEIESVGFGAYLSLTVEVRARNSEFSRTMQAFSVISANEGAVAPAGNGTKASK